MNPLFLVLSIGDAEVLGDDVLSVKRLKLNGGTPFVRDGGASANWVLW